MRGDPAKAFDAEALAQLADGRREAVLMNPLSNGRHDGFLALREFVAHGHLAYP